MNDKFTIFLQNLSPLIGTPLLPEKGRLCRLNINHSFDIQIQWEENKNRLLFGSFFAEIPPGKFRENALKSALKYNALYPRLGNLSYTKKGNLLLFFTYLYGLDPEKAGNLLAALIEEITTWKTALDTGNLPYAKEEKMSPFGIKP